MNRKIKLDDIKTDITILLSNAQKIGWESLKENSIHRILYLCSILYPFKYNTKINPFRNTYEFSIDLKGPHCNDIDKAIVSLESFFIINNFNNSLNINTQYIPPAIEKSPNYELKKEWIVTILYILFSYGESKIYDFVFEDPEYQYKLLSNTSNTLNLGNNNETNLNLKIFKSAFEKSLAGQIDLSKIDQEKYLTLYFDYVFSKILKGEKFND